MSRRRKHDEGMKWVMAGGDAGIRRHEEELRKGGERSKEGLAAASSPSNMDQMEYRRSR